MKVKLNGVIFGNPMFSMQYLINELFVIKNASELMMLGGENLGCAKNILVRYGYVKIKTDKNNIIEYLE